MTKLILIFIFILLTVSSVSKAEMIGNEQDLNRIFDEFERFSRHEFLTNYPIPVEMKLQITGASYTTMNGRTGFTNELNSSVGKPGAVKAHVQLFFSNHSFSENYSREGFIWIACHELGHLVGGDPINGYLEGFSSQEGLTIEGQADYFASEACMGKWLDWIEANNLSKSSFTDARTQDPSIPEDCEKRFNNLKDIENCQTKLMAAAEGFRLIGEKNFKYTNIDDSKIDYMYTAHPKLECRGATAFSAIMGFERPSCWFYPDKLKKLDLNQAIEDSLSEPIVNKTFCGKMNINLEIIQKNFEKKSWEFVWKIKNFKAIVREYKDQVNSMISFCKTKSLDDAEKTEKYLIMVVKMKRKLRF